MNILMRLILSIMLLLTAGSSLSEAAFLDPAERAAPAYLPIVLYHPEMKLPADRYPRVNAPFFTDTIRFAETAIFWFGQVNSQDNYADIRVGYNADELYVYLAAFDRYLWYAPAPQAATLTDWDAASLYLDLLDGAAAVPGGQSYWFVGQMNWWEERSDYQAVYQGSGSGWEPTDLSFTTVSGWRGNVPNNNDEEDRGWTLAFHIPFVSLGLAGPPAQGTRWGLGMVLHDRDAAGEPPLPVKTWPTAFAADQPVTWGQLNFGLPEYSIPPVAATGQIVLRQGLNGEIVTDGEVGGGTVCGSGLDFWNEWGDAVFPGSETNADFNIQNQADVADWPCFAKYYVTFPLDSLPGSKVIISATLTLHQFGNAGGGIWGEPPSSLIQVFTIAEDWDEQSLSWNQAPLARENVSQAWVDWLLDFPGWPGAARQWNLDRATAEAYSAGTPLRLALYSADSAYHSGKYFVTSETGDWNALGRPTLDIVWGDP